MAGIYLHIPFCKQACHYCNFHFATSLRYKNEFIDALLKEIELSAVLHPLAEEVETIYFGGGTPSILSPFELEKILKTARAFFNVNPAAEITVEANPDDIKPETPGEWKQAGINRLSIGIQSFFDEDLEWMNRAHDKGQAVKSLERATHFFDNISIDLIYGTPALTDERWLQNVETATGFGIPHLSCYALTVEPKTPLDKMIRQQQSPDINPERQSRQFLQLMDWLTAKGYEHYEISNFARPGYRSRHNSSYWMGKPYLGFGPSAHSYDGNRRWWNVSNNQQYIQGIGNGVLPQEKEVLSDIQKTNEYIMIALRTKEGIDLGKLEKRLESTGSVETFLKKINSYSEKLLSIKNNHAVLTNQGKLFADGIAAELFVD